MCKICRNENLEGLEYLECNGCQSLTNIPNIKGLKKLYCYGCLLITTIPHIEGLEGLICSDCPLLTNIPNIKGLVTLACYNCPLLTTIPHIKELEFILCNNCPLLITIPYIKGLERLTCFSCPLLMYIASIGYIRYNGDLLKLPFKDCKYLTSKKMDKLYNNIYYLWKSYKLKKYALYLEKEYYSNPRLPYMKYYIENELYDGEGEGESFDSTTQSNLKIGYINSKQELIWYKF